jgi:hypothetical protein
MNEDKMREMEERLEKIEKAVDPWPQALKIYKGAGGKWGALQIELTPVHRSKRDLGALFVSAANPTGTGEKNYDWENKVVMSWNLGDIAKVLDIIVNQKPNDDGKIMMSLFHDPHAGSADARKSSKVFNIAKLDKGWFVGLSHKEGDRTNEVKLPLSEGEILQIKTLLERATARILGW